MWQRILVGLDGSPLGRQAFQAALELAELYRASLVALSVVEGASPRHRETEEAESFDYYRRVQANAAGLTLDTAMRRGHAARALVECAQEIGADVIIIGATGHEHPWSLMTGGTAWRVTNEARCAVIVVRPIRTVRWVQDIMVRHVSAVTPQTSLADPEEADLKRAIRTMAAHRIKHLPVVDAQGQLVGMLSRADVLRAVAAGAEPVQEEAAEVAPSPSACTVGDLMLTEVPTAKVETPIDEVVHLVLSSPSRRVVITDSEGVVRGIITDRRLLARAAANIQPGFLQALGDLVDAVSIWRGARGPLSAGDLMRTDVFTVRADEPIIHAIRLMMQRQVKRLVVVDDADRLQGVVDRQTLLQWLAEASRRDWV